MDDQVFYLDIKDLPHYKSIVKCVLRKQIQQLLEEMSSEVGEESLIMMVNPKNGTISHHGSHAGKAFLQNKGDFKTQFLTFCIANTGQNSSLNHEHRKRKVVTGDITRPVKQQKSATQPAESPSSVSETPRSLVRTALAKKQSLPQDSLNKATSDENTCMPEISTSYLSASKRLQADQPMPSNLTVNQNSLSQVLFSPPLLMCPVPDRRSTESESSEIQALHQVKEDHPYSKDRCKTSQTVLIRNNCNDKESLTNYYLGSNTNEIQTSVQDCFETKCEVKQDDYDLEDNVVIDETDWTVNFNTLNSAGNIVQEDGVNANKSVAGSDTRIKLNGVQIDFRLPKLQPSVRLEMCNPVEKRVTPLLGLTGSFHNSPETNRIIGGTHIGETCVNLVKESMMNPSRFHAEGTSDTLNETSVLLEEIESDTIKIEPLSDFDSPVRNTHKKHISNSEPLCDFDSPMRDAHNKHNNSNREQLSNLKDTQRGTCWKHVTDSESLNELESPFRNAHEKSNVTNSKPLSVFRSSVRENHKKHASNSEPLSDLEIPVRKSPRRQRFSTKKLLNMDDSGEVEEAGLVSSPDCSSSAPDKPNDQGNTNERNQEIKGSNQEKKDARNTEVKDSNQKKEDAGTEEIVDSASQAFEDQTGIEIKTEQSTTGRSRRSCLENSLKDFIGDDVTLIEVDDTFEDFEVFECLSSGSEWKQSEGEDSSSDDEQILDENIDDIEDELNNTAVNYIDDYSGRYWQKPDKFIYDNHGNILGRKLKEEDKVFCVKHKDIYIKKFKKGNLNSKSGRFFDNMHPCLYCRKLFLQIWSHLQGRHRDESEVEEVLNLKADRDMIDDCTVKARIDQMILKKQRLLSRRAVHEHNMMVMNLKKGELFLPRRNLVEAFNSEAYGPCPECFVWCEIKKGYTAHKRRCPANVKASLSDIMVQNLFIQGKILASASKEMQKEVFPLMPNDRLTKTVKSDPLIIALGELHLMDRIGRIERRMYHASYKMRVAARLVHIFRKETKSETASMSDCLQVEHFDLLAKCAVQVVSKHSQQEIQSSVFGKRLGKDLLKLVSAKIGGLRKIKSNKGLEDAKKFYSLLQEQWKQAIQAQVIIVNKERKAQQKINHEDRMERVKALLNEERLNTEASLKQQRLKESSSSQDHEKSRNEHSVVSTSLSEKKIIPADSNTKQKLLKGDFDVNIERGEKSSENGLENSKKGQKSSEKGQESSGEQQATSDEVRISVEESKTDEKCDPEDLVRLARYLAKELDKPSVSGDFSTPEKYRYLVTLTLVYLVLYNSCDVERIQSLTLETYRRKLRQSGEADTSLYIGITELERELVKTQDLIELRSAVYSEQEPLSLQSALDAVRENAELNKPSGITVNNLKKYTSTIFQVTSLDEETLLEFVKDIGLIEKLNLEEGQSIAGVKDRLEIAKLIFIQEQGKTEKLRTLQEISFEEIEEELPTKDLSTNCDFDSDDEDNFGDYYPRKPRKKSAVPKEMHVRVPWSKAENEEIHLYFDHYITLQTKRPCPGMKEILRACLKSKSSGGEIRKRDWEVIKKKVSYLIQKTKKKQFREREESD